MTCLTIHHRINPDSSRILTLSENLRLSTHVNRRALNSLFTEIRTQMSLNGTYCKVKDCEGVGGYKEMQGFCAYHWQQARQGEVFETSPLRYFGSPGRWNHHSLCGWCTLPLDFTWIGRAICFCGCIEFCIYLPFVLNGNE